MRNFRHILFMFALISFNAEAQKESFQFTSPPQQTALIELYTSEGCSSCPPADRWLSGLTDNPGLWTEWVPVAFHVDYWNYLGWEDRFSQAAFSKRQRAHARQKNIGTVYTPGFVVNGSEWRGWFANQSLPNQTATLAGVLNVEVTKQQITATFFPQRNYKKPLQLHMASLGSDLRTYVRQGENRGKTLRHDFVVLDVYTLPGQVTASTQAWSFAGAIPIHAFSNASAMAFWITTVDSLMPLQATGGWLKP
jgi:hypothetical protein